MNQRTLKENKMKHIVIGFILYPSVKYKIEVSVKLKDEHYKKHWLKSVTGEMYNSCLATNRMPSIGDTYLTDDDTAEYTIKKVYPGKNIFSVILELTEIIK